MKKLFFIGTIAIIFASLQSPNVSAQIIEFVGPKIDTSFTLYVDYDRSVKDLITAGNYGYVNDDINRRNFSKEKSSGKDTLQVSLISSSKVLSLENILFWMEKKQMRPATLKELQMLGIQMPNLQRKFSIVALGSESEKLDLFPSLGLAENYFKNDNHLDAFVRILYLLHPFNDNWGVGYHFLAIKKE